VGGAVSPRRRIELVWGAPSLEKLYEHRQVHPSLNTYKMRTNIVSKEKCRQREITNEEMHSSTSVETELEDSP